MKKLKRNTLYYHDNGNIKSETIQSNKKLLNHNEYGPSYIEYYECGNKLYEHYCFNNMWHNINGAARIWYDVSGNITEKEYYLNDEYLKNIKSDEELKQYIKLQNIL